MRLAALRAPAPRSRSVRRRLSKGPPRLKPRPSLRPALQHDPTIPGVATTGQSQLAVLFRQGEIGIILWGDWYIPYLTADDFKPGSEFGVFSFPKLNPDAPNAIIFETGPFCLAKNSGQLTNANTLQDIVMEEIRPGRSGNEILAASRAA